MVPEAHIPYPMVELLSNMAASVLHLILPKCGFTQERVSI